MVRLDGTEKQISIVSNGRSAPYTNRKPVAVPDSSFDAFSSLETVELCNVAVAEKLFFSLIQANLTSLLLDDCNLSAEQEKMLAKGLENKQALTTLGLPRMHFSPESAVAIVRAAAALPLTKLDLRQTRLDNPALVELAGWLRTNRSLVELHFSPGRRQSSTDWPERLAEALPSNSSLQTMKITPFRQGIDSKTQPALEERDIALLVGGVEKNSSLQNAELISSFYDLNNCLVSKETWDSFKEKYEPRVERAIGTTEPLRRSSALARA